MNTTYIVAASPTSPTLVEITSTSSGLTLYVNSVSQPKIVVPYPAETLARKAAAILCRQVTATVDGPDGTPLVASARWFFSPLTTTGGSWTPLIATGRSLEMTSPLPTLAPNCSYALTVPSIDGDVIITDRNSAVPVLMSARPPSGGVWVATSSTPGVFMDRTPFKEDPASTLASLALPKLIPGAQYLYLFQMRFQVATNASGSVNLRVVDADGQQKWSAIVPMFDSGGYHEGYSFFTLRYDPGDIAYTTYPNIPIGNDGVDDMFCLTGVPIM